MSDRVKLKGRFTFSAPQDKVWDILMDADRIALALPWVEQLTPVPDTINAWQAVASITFYSEQDIYTGIIQLADLDAPHQYTIHVSGSGSDNPMQLNATVHIRLKYDEEHEKTLLHWRAETTLPDKMADMKPGMIQMGANMMSMIFFSRLGKLLAGEELSDYPDKDR